MGECGAAAAGLGQKPCCDPDADSLHGRQDLGKRVGIKDPLAVFGDSSALVSERQGLARDAGQDPGRSRRTRRCRGGSGDVNGDGLSCEACQISAASRTWTRGACLASSRSIRFRPNGHSPAGRPDATSM